MVACYRAHYRLHASSGILYNHESPRRAVDFVTRKFTRTAFGFAGIEVDEHVVVDPQFVRPLDRVPLVGSADRAREKLGWVPRTSFEDMIGAMVEADLRELGR